LEAGQIPSEKFEILKQMHRNPEDEKNAKSQPHVQVALRLNATKKFHFRSGDIMRYVICKVSCVGSSWLKALIEVVGFQDGTTNSHTQRAYHLTEVAAEPDRLSIDVDYYLSNQILPVVTRLCEPIDELPSTRIANALGLDSKRYGGGGGKKGGDKESEWVPHQSAEPEHPFGLEQDFAACEGFQLECAECKHVSVIRGPLLEKEVSRNARGNCV